MLLNEEVAHLSTNDSIRISACVFVQEDGEDSPVRQLQDNIFLHVRNFHIKSGAIGVREEREEG